MFPHSPLRVDEAASEVPVGVLLRKSLPEQGLPVARHPALQ
jgi:hypothetical protein